MILDMWRPTMFLFCLIAALAGTPLRQAEAAEDFARSFEEHGIATVDGGVGDDTEVSVLKAGATAEFLATSRSLAIAVVPSPPLSAPTRTARCRPDRSPGAATHDDRRFGRLQRLRF